MVSTKDLSYHSVRGKHGVGKFFPPKKWIHISALDALPEDEQNLVKNAISRLPRPLPKNTDIVIRINRKVGEVMFSESPDWNSASEPLQGLTHKVSNLYTDSPSVELDKIFGNQPIYHHKWMFVKEDYEGFDVQESKDWSETWMNSEVVRNLLKTNPTFFLQIGSKQYWKTHVLDPILTK